MPPWKQTPTYNLLPNDAAVLEKHGQKRRRSENELTRGVMPNERGNQPTQSCSYLMTYLHDCTQYKGIY